MRTLLTITGLCVFLLCLRLLLFFGSAETDYSDGEVVLQTTLRSDPKAEGSTQRITAFTSSGSRILVTTSRFPAYHYGQELRIEGEVKRIVTDKGSELLVMSFPQIQVVREHKNVLYSLAFSFRERISSVFERTLVYPYSGLLIGIVFGVREGIPEELSKALIATGVVHITAASGMNVTLVAGAMFFVFASFLKRKTAMLVSVVAIWFYAVIAGFDSSITRATIMASIAFSAALLGRQYAGWYGLFLTGCVMVFTNPLILADVGFQLSFVSTLGILFLVPLVRRENKAEAQTLWFLRDDFHTTIAAQAFAIPILLSHFGTLSPFSVLVNILILWTIPFLMVLGGLAALLSLIFPPLSIPILYLALPLLWYITEVVLLSETFLPTVTFKAVPLSFTIAYYLLLAAFCLILYRRRKNEKI